jgi:subtilisin family serine protease
MRLSLYKRAFALWILLTAALLLPLGRGPVEAQRLDAPVSQDEYARGLILVQLRRGVDAARLLAESRGPVRVVGQIPALGVLQLQVSPGSEQSALTELRRDSRVVYAGLDRRVSALEAPNDPRWSEQWAPLKVGAAQAWDVTHCQGVIVALLDSGAYLEHPDLHNTLWTNMGEIPGNGVDDDGNGKVDDIHGWHFFHQWNGSIDVPYENPIVEDDYGHGTHVTGIAAAETNNAVGVASLSWGARAMVVKVLDEQGNGWYSDVAAGIVYAVDNGAQVINLSLGGHTPDPILQAAVDYAYLRGALLVAAAGNDGGDVLYPAACDHVVAVAATDPDDARPSFSNYGPQVDIAAPGENILSTWREPYLYYYKRGTSMAAAYVSGAAALLWSYRSDWTNAEIEQRLETQADDVNAAQYPGQDPFLGWGRLNLERALAGLQPGPTRTPTATATPTASATWTPSPTPTATPTTTSSVTPTGTPWPTATDTPGPTHYAYRVLLIFKDSWQPQ